MITVRSNANKVLGGLQNRLTCFNKNGTCLRTTMQSIAQTILPVVRNRIHAQGIAADGSFIGAPNRANGYLTVSGRLKNELGIIQHGSNYGLGWIDNTLANRAHNAEKRYNKKIWGLTPDEKAIAKKIAEENVAI